MTVDATPASAVRLKLYDRRGRLIDTIVLGPGEDFRQYEWQGRPRKVRRVEIVREGPLPSRHRGFGPIARLFLPDESPWSHR